MKRRRRRPRHDAVQRRNRIVICLDAGLTPSQVAQRLKLSRMTVWRAEQRFKALLAERGIDIVTGLRDAG